METSFDMEFYQQLHGVTFPRFFSLATACKSFTRKVVFFGAIRKYRLSCLCYLEFSLGFHYLEVRCLFGYYFAGLYLFLLLLMLMLRFEKFVFL